MIANQLTTLDRIKKLEEDVWKLKAGIGVAISLAVALGLVGALGWSSFSAAAVTLQGFKQEIATQKALLDGNKDEFKSNARIAVDGALREMGAGKKIESMEKRLEGLGAHGPGAEIKVVTPAGNGVNTSATCEPGYVAQGVKLNLGGTCKNACDGDGRPVSSYSVTCVKL